MVPASTGNPPYSNLAYLQGGTGINPSGAHVYSAESDSAVRCKHGEFESSHAQVSSLLVRRGVGRSQRAHQAAAGDGSWPGLAAQLLITPTLEQLGGDLASGCNTGTGLTT